MKSCNSPGVYRLLLVLGLGLYGVGAISPIAHAADAESPFLALNQTAMDKMMAGMEVKPTGDADTDFVAMMVPHHQGAIDMATAEIQFGHNEKLLRIAQGIIVQQEQEIVAMRLAIGEPATPTWNTSGEKSAPSQATKKDPRASDDAFISRSNAAMNKMMSDMDVKPTGDVDRDFVAMMVPHHQGAIDMAEAELASGQNPTLKTIAQEIVVEQQQEIALMRLAVNETLPQSTAAPTQPSVGAMQGAPAHEPDIGPSPMAPGMQMAPSVSNH